MKEFLSSSKGSNIVGVILFLVVFLILNVFFQLGGAIGGAIAGVIGFGAAGAIKIALNKDKAS